MRTFELTAEEADALGRALWHALAHGLVDVKELDMAKKITKKLLAKMADLVIERKAIGKMRFTLSEISLMAELLDGYWETGSPAFRRIFDQIRRAG